MVVPISEPARSTEAARLREIAVLPFEGPNEREFVTHLEATLAAIKFNDTSHFRVVERQRLDSLMREIRLSQSGVVSNQEALRLGRVLGVRALYTGTVEPPNHTISHSQQSRSTCASYAGKKCTKWTESSVGCQRANAIYAFTPKVIEVETGRIVYSNRLVGTTTAFTCSDSSNPLPSQQEMIANARTLALEKLRGDIAPSTSTLKIRLHESPEGISEESAKRKLTQGMEFAKANRLDRACELWREAFQTAPRSVALTYNLGICSEVAGDLVSAADHYRRADRLLEKPDAAVSEALARIMRRQEDAAKLSTQIRR